MKIKKEVRTLVFKKYEGRCSYCGCDIKLKTFQVDHIEPLFRGSTQDDLDYYGRTKGKNHLDNYNPSCKSCNASKSTFTIEQWRQELEMKESRLHRDSSTFRILKRFNVVRVNSISIIFYFESYGKGITIF